VARSLSIVNTFAVFDCPDMNSHATLPVVVAVPVDEFEEAPLAIATSVIVLPQGTRVR